MIRYFALLICLKIISLSYAQSPRIGSFFLEKTLRNQVIVNWSMKAGSTCPSLQVERKVNGQFKLVYTYPSVCGEEDREVFYSWIDEAAPNYSVVEYRIKLDESEFTFPESIDLDSDLRSNKIVLYPNPVNSGDKLFVKFRNQFLIFDFVIYNRFGQKVYEGKTNRTSGFEVSKQFEQGIYYLKIIDAEFEDPVAFIVI